MTERKCCPECGSVSISRKIDRQGMGARDHLTKYRCNECQHHFDEPDWTDTPRQGPKTGPAARLAAIGERRDA